MNHRSPASTIARTGGTFLTAKSTEGGVLLRSYYRHGPRGTCELIGRKMATSWDGAFKLADKFENGYVYGLSPKINTWLNTTR